MAGGELFGKRGNEWRGIASKSLTPIFQTDKLERTSDESRIKNMPRYQPHALLTVLIVQLFVPSGAGAADNVQAPPETSARWVKYAQNPVLGGNLGTCFDISVLKEGETYRMWFSWRPKKSIALVESKDGIEWSKPLIVLGPNAKTDWENDLNRPVVISGFEM